MHTIHLVVFTDCRLVHAHMCNCACLCASMFYQNLEELTDEDEDEDGGRERCSSIEHHAQPLSDHIQIIRVNYDLRRNEKPKCTANLKSECQQKCPETFRR